jgi:hypothetical protein
VVGIAFVVLKPLSIGQEVLIARAAHEMVAITLPVCVAYIMGRKVHIALYAVVVIGIRLDV